ncbi:MAG: hypothetical protein H0A75_03415 [Candidatus Methanofishera endochildressiae]|uniref:Uncharacterized protein n=1 Tax=Candidatus Methanofishera endochildressiae TaxID=2738884 RepID=A0A7Z0MN83_9GAMM|nr:hypothetical protein [Candidatus Methanofishera endochildressiae]
MAAEKFFLKKRKINLLKNENKMPKKAKQLKNGSEMDYRSTRIQKNIKTPVKGVFYFRNTTHNSTNYITFTNHKDALPLSQTDRRWWVINVEINQK